MVRARRAGSGGGPCAGLRGNRLARIRVGGWNDLPANARAELRDEQRRPGLLDGGQLREPLKQRYAIASTIEHAETPSSECLRNASKPSAPKQPPRGRSPRSAAYRVAEDVLANYDRTLHRRKHATEITAARLDIERLPSAAEAADSELGIAVSKLDHLRQEEAQAKDALRRRPDFETRIDAIEERPDHDLRVRTKIARLEAPDVIVDTLGDRPAPGPAARQCEAPRAGSLNTKPLSRSRTTSAACPEFLNQTRTSRAGPMSRS